MAPSKQTLATARGRGRTPTRTGAAGFPTRPTSSSRNKVSPSKAKSSVVTEARSLKHGEQNKLPLQVRWMCPFEVLVLLTLIPFFAFILPRSLLSLVWNITELRLDPIPVRLWQDLNHFQKAKWLWGLIVSGEFWAIVLLCGYHLRRFGFQLNSKEINEQDHQNKLRTVLSQLLYTSILLGFFTVQNHTENAIYRLRDHTDMRDPYGVMGFGCILGQSIMCWLLYSAVKEIRVYLLKSKKVKSANTEIIVVAAARKNLVRLDYAIQGLIATLLTVLSYRVCCLVFFLLLDSREEEQLYPNSNAVWWLRWKTRLNGANDRQLAGLTGAEGEEAKWRVITQCVSLTVSVTVGILSGLAALV
ncbi:unnamed protein product [Amoebophrya sp. A120]|nr:unnamed protein product [Amoebophrya sp. A120]|eukprot:GSA120T00016052001.1